MDLERLRKRYMARKEPLCPICHAASFTESDYAMGGDPDVLELIDALEAANTLMENITANWIDPNTLKTSGYLSDDEMNHLMAVKHAKSSI